ncbi:MAPEG family protein [Leptolyngbya sp. FACHB-671]|uniref:MAPEG family protein n=1 Tax=Leptolyngbya sp. FACHB-671 TaxID=2692812 RepID=UPI0016874C1F|nr:MAPEG family protein [Leptolyngbya sp. FACHB-671]MBD1867109.1 MAPEG family protein [Cyanobacteria bacterium FACHB-471]MBD2070056.1 MAPEG family protein [Leptolyngbya sp. FACHB-671]
MSIPISTFFVGLNGFIAFALSYIVVMERTRTRIWHGETEAALINQPNYLERPNKWAAFVENCTQKSLLTKADDGILQRKVRAYGNFTEYVPLGLLFIITLELMHSSPWILWLIGSALTIGRVAHAWGLITTYGPSPSRAVGFFLTWFVYIVGAAACIYSSAIAILWDAS